MNNPPTSNAPNASISTEPKPGKNQFKCFQCRKIFPMKDGDWHVWNAMEVHLCISCDKSTKARPERA